MGKEGEVQRYQSTTRAVWISCASAFFLLFLKLYAYYRTGSAAILSDFSESVIHLFAIGFATFSLYLSFKPADLRHQYGHDKIAFFSAGFEGAMIGCAALYIIYESTLKCLYGYQAAHLLEGAWLIGIATVINASLGIWLLSQGKAYQSLILQAHGRHVLTDCVTSISIIAGLFIVHLTGYFWIDPLLGIGIAIHILISGIQLLRESIGGLMDASDSIFDREVKGILDAFTQEHGIDYHRVRHRKAGHTTFLEFHLLFPDTMTLAIAHDIATQLEAKLHDTVSCQLDVTSHLEPREHHNASHAQFSMNDEFLPKQ